MDSPPGIVPVVEWETPEEPESTVLDDSSGAHLPAVSVVVPILNEARTIGRTLESILSQSYADFELLAVDGMSEDGTRDIVESFAARDARVALIDNPRRSIPSALNVALAAARGRYLVRVDAHSEIPADYIERMVSRLDDGEWVGVGARKRAVGGPPSGAVIAAVLGSPFGVGGSEYHYVTETKETDHIPFGCYRVDAARAIGGWDERLLANEDYEFDVRLRAAGGRLLLDHSVEVAWKCRSRMIDLARQYRRYGRGKADVAFLHPGELRLRHLAPPVAVGALAAAVPLAAVRPTLSAVIFAGYVAAVSALSIGIIGELPSWRDKARVPLALMAMQLPWGLGMWEGLVRIARNGFSLPDASEEDTSRWGSPKWAIEESSEV